MVAAVVGNAVEGPASQVRREGNVSVARGVRVPQLDGAVAGAGQKALGLAAQVRKTHALDDPFVCLHREQLLARGEVPDLDFAVSGAGGDHVEGARVLGQGVDAVDVAVAELGDEGRGKHALEFGGIEGASVFTGFFEGVEFGVEIAGLRDGGGAGGVVGLGGAGEGSDFLRGGGIRQTDRQRERDKQYHGELFSHPVGVCIAIGVCCIPV